VLTLKTQFSEKAKNKEKTFSSFEEKHDIRDKHLHNNLNIVKKKTIIP